MPVDKKSGVVELRAYDTKGNLVEEVEISVEEYHGGLHDLVDADAYRAERDIVVLEGKVFDPEGKLDQEFRNRYASSSAYDGGTARHADGTTYED